MQCLNCSTEVVSNFCPECGQSKKIKRIDNRDLYIELPKSILNLESGFGYTLWSLLKNPVKTAREYIEGKRVKYHKPFPFYLIVITATTIFMNWFLPDLFDGLTGTGNEEAIRMDRNIANILQNNPAITFVLGTPLFAFSFYLAFRKFKDTFAEHVYLQVFASAYTNLITFIPMILLTKYLSPVWAMYSTIVVFLGMMTIYVLYYWGKASVLNLVLRSFLGIFLVIVFFVLVVVLGSLIYLAFKG